MVESSSDGKEQQQSRYDKAQQLAGNIGLYQAVVILTNQLATIAVTGSILCVSFDTKLPATVNCTADHQEQTPVAPLDDVNGANSDATSSNSFGDVEFFSLLLEWGMLCPKSYVSTLFSTTVMLGGVSGAVAVGYMADRFGRKPACVGTLVGISILNVLIVLVAVHSWWLFAALLFVLGFFCGGNMVVSLVICMEAVGTDFWRLFVSAFNGWPLGLMSMAGLGYFTANWRLYHISLASISLLFLVPMQLFVKESARWLYNHDRYEEADDVLAYVARFNRRSYYSLLKEVSLSPSLLRGNKSANKFIANATADSSAARHYNYCDLFRHSAVYLPLIALAYSFLTSSVLSFGVYFNLKSLPGNDFLKIFLMGLFKAIAGSSPFFISLIGTGFGRKRIFVISAVLACCCTWTIVVLYLFGASNSASLTALSLISAAAIDPIWKVNHLYSAELFPTVVRNMARAVCSTLSRVGSVIAPSIAYLAYFNPALPYIVFGTMTLVQIFVGIFILPETRDQKLPDKLPSDSQGLKNDSGDNKYNGSNSTELVPPPINIRDTSSQPLSTEVVAVTESSKDTDTESFPVTTLSSSDRTFTV